MNCPKCQTAMTIGLAEFSSWSVSLLEAMIHPTLVTFREPGGKGKSVAKIWDLRAAHKCPACGGLFIAAESEPLPRDSIHPYECGQCGITLKPGRTDCHFCGWQKQTKPADQ